MQVAHEKLARLVRSAYTIHSPLRGISPFDKRRADIRVAKQEAGVQAPGK